MAKPFLTIKEASEMLGISTEKLRNWERDDKITPTYTTGGHRRFPRIEIEKLAGTETKRRFRTSGWTHDHRSIKTRLFYCFSIR